jgi:hypothetical protein
VKNETFRKQFTPTPHYMKKGCIIAAAVGLVFLALVGAVVLFAFTNTSGVADAGHTIV